MFRVHKQRYNEWSLALFISSSPDDQPVFEFKNDGWGLATTGFIVAFSRRFVADFSG
jgi:hypothetical protein